MSKETNETTRRNKDHSFISTYDSKQTLSPTQMACFDDIARFFNAHKRQFNKGNDFSKKARKDYVKSQTFNDGEGQKNAMNYRFFQGIYQELKGLHKSIQSNRENYLYDKEDRLKILNKEIIELSKQYHRLIDNQTKVINHQFEEEKDKKLRYLRSQYKKQQYLLNDIENLSQKENYSICFGTKKLMKQRHQLKTPQEIHQWQEQWDKKRNNQFLLVGSHDETQGNMNCQVTYNKKKNIFSMKIRVPYCLEKKHGKYCIINKLNIPIYLRNPLKKEIEKHQVKSTQKNALSFRFIRLNDNQYRFLFTLNKDRKEIITPTNKGVIGVDINTDHFAIVEINETGKIQSHQSIYYNLADKTQHQRKAIIHEKVNKIRDLALAKNKPIVIENLNFKQKRQQLYKNKNKHFKSLLSGFAYQQMIDAFTRLMYEYGILVKKVSPSYSSLLGETLAKDASLTIHQAAAWVLARRFYQFKEKIKKVFTIVYRSKPFMVYIPREIYREHNLKKLKRWLCDVRKYIDGSLPKKNRKELSDKIFLSINGRKQLQPVI